ncbi:hypothetical protein CTA2_8371 [Colletotrichum tanaceti]|nr:hypothetical protein CTA2_8371 [Colletotrichum tanaceti]
MMTACRTTMDLRFLDGLGGRPPRRLTYNKPTRGRCHHAPDPVWLPGQTELRHTKPISPALPGHKEVCCLPRARERERESPIYRTGSTDAAAAIRCFNAHAAERASNPYEAYLCWHDLAFPLWLPSLPLAPPHLKSPGPRTRLLGSPSALAQK